MNRLKTYAFVLMAVTGVSVALACTSAIVSARLTRDGQTLLWKHRDTGNHDNFIERVAASDGRYGYVALFNGGDSLLLEAWAGMNDAGFGIINTASYNLAPDTARYRDREGRVMSQALALCRTLSDFECLLDTLAKPMGVQANFGVIDSSGKGAYFETDDYGRRRYGLGDSLLIRTNYSHSGDTVTEGYGYIRYANASHLLAPAIARRDVTPRLLTDTISSSFYHALWGKDMVASNDDEWLVDQDFIPRYSSTASVAMVSGEHPQMWVILGYPPLSRAVCIDDFDAVPDSLRPIDSGYTSPACNRANATKRRVFSIGRGSGTHYINLTELKKILDNK